MRIGRFIATAALAGSIAASHTAAQTAAEQSPRDGLKLLDAVAITLGKHPLLRIQEQQVGISRGQRMQATSRFDLALQTGFEQDRTNTPLSRYDQLVAAQSGFFTNAQAANLSTINGGFEKLFRNGVILKPTFTLTRDTNNLAAYDGLNESNTGLTIIFPLLRGRGRTVVGAQEKAAVLEMEATALDTSHAAAQLVSNTAASYWGLVAARRRLSIAIASEERGRSLVESVQAFIDADRTPRTEINDVRANLADRSSGRLAAEQRVIAARIQLALDMGLSPADMTSVGDPATAFPKVDPKGVLPTDNAALEYYQGQALQRRADYLAARKRITEAGEQVVFAKDSLQPDLRFSFSAGYSSLREGTRVDRWLISPFSGVHGVNAIGGFTYTFPRANNFAKGQVMQVDSQARQAEYKAAEVARQISSAVAVAVEAVRHAVERVQTATQAVESFESALSGQREKYRLGLASVVDVLTTEDRLTNALLNQVDAEYSYATALVDLRYASGTLLAEDKAEQTVRPDTFETTPFRGEPIPSSMRRTPTAPAMTAARGEK